jgi:heme/copper-type cytochrome/quinol oxidase subunit 4
MKAKKSPFQPHALLWWVAIISLAVSIALFIFMGSQAEVDVNVRQQRMMFPLIGIVIAGVCLIWGTAGRWFYPK